MKKKTLIIIGLIVIIVGAGLLTSYLVSVRKYKDAVANITYDNIDASGVPDGTYIGDCDTGLIYAKTEVSVRNGLITSIVLLEHRHERGDAAEGIIKEIIARQKIDVDAVSGATNSSRVIKKAIDNALSSGKENGAAAH